MKCPKCNGMLAGKNVGKVNYCPFCGEKLFDSEREYLIEVDCFSLRDSDSPMMLFLDDSAMYEIQPGNKIYLSAKAGFHVLKFRYKIRTKKIQILLRSNYRIKAHFNTLSGLIETIVNEKSDKSERSGDQEEVKLAKPSMVTTDGKRGLDVMLGDDEPEFEIRVSTGLKEGTLRIYSERMEFSADNELKKDITQFKNVVAVKKKLGSIDVQCEGKVHKIYSIPKDIYNEVMAFLNNRVQ